MQRAPRRGGRWSTFRCFEPRLRIRRRRRGLRPGRDRRDGDHGGGLVRMTGTAYERFTPSGPLAVLPPAMMAAYGVIWTCRPADAAEVFYRSTTMSYLRELQRRFGWRAGRFVRVGRRASYPLKLTRATTTIATRTVLIGNAAQALHPVAGQGFKLRSTRRGDAGGGDCRMRRELA